MGVTTMNATIYNHTTGEARTLPQVRAEQLARNSKGIWSFAPPLPIGWDQEIPRYRAMVAVKPAELARYRFERPFTSNGDSSVWQYGTEPIAAGQNIETTSWPHASFMPLNESAKRVSEFLTSRQKSRLQVSPWRDGRLHLDDGLSGAAPYDSLLPRPESAAVPETIRVARR